MSEADTANRHKAHRSPTLMPPLSSPPSHSASDITALKVNMTTPASSSHQRPIARRAHKKSRTGCRTCKIRKVKCDERRPLCVNCERHYTNLIQCDFDDAEPVVNPSAIPPYAARDREVAGASSSRLVPIRRNSPLGRESETTSHEVALTRSVAAGRLDPFEARPASEEPAPNVDALIGHCKLFRTGTNHFMLTFLDLANFAYRSFPFYASKPLIEMWWPFVRSDEVLFHVVLLLSGLDRDHLQSQHNTLHTRQLLDQCLSLLNSRVQDPVAGTNDHTLVAIASLAAMEHDRGNMRALDMHLEGLKKGVEARGGLEVIRSTNAMAANLVFWCAMVSINEPGLLPLTYGDYNRDFDLSNPETATLITHDGGEADLRDSGVDVRTANLLHEVQRLSRLYTSTLNYRTPQEAVDVLSYLCSILDRLLQMSKLPSSDSPVPGLSQSCRIAGCLHVLAPMAGYSPDPTLMLHSLCRDLKASLTYMIRALGTKSYLLLWLLAVGGITAHSMPERTWFVGHLVVVVTDLSISNWEAMRRSLVKLAFHDNFCDENFNKLWNEVKEKQKSLNLIPM